MEEVIEIILESGVVLLTGKYTHCERVYCCDSIYMRKDQCQETYDLHSVLEVTLKLKLKFSLLWKFGKFIRSSNSSMKHIHFIIT